MFEGSAVTVINLSTGSEIVRARKLQNRGFRQILNFAYEGILVVDKKESSIFNQWLRVTKMKQKILETYQ